MQIGNSSFATFTDSNVGYWLKDAGAVWSIDFTSMRFAGPSCVVAAASLIEMASSAGVEVDYRPPPTDSDVARYLSRMGLRDVLESAGYDSGLPFVNSHPPKDRFVPLQRFGGDAAAEDIIEVVESHMKDWEERKRLSDCFIELGLNIDQHAGAPGFAMAQWYGKKDIICLCVADVGCTIPVTLERAGFQFDSHTGAIRNAVTEFTTSKASGDGGFGLPTVCRLITRDRKGKMVVVSGGGGIKLVDDKQVDLQIGWPGTMLILEVPTS